MYLKTTATNATLWLSADDTERWANGIAPDQHGAWPCSEIRCRRVRAVFDRTGLVDVAFDNGRGSQDCNAGEFSAITSDFLRDKLPGDHPVWFVTVGQFKP